MVGKPALPKVDALSTGALCPSLYMLLSVALAQVLSFKDQTPDRLGPFSRLRDTEDLH